MPESYRPATARAVLEALIRAGMVKDLQPDSLVSGDHQLVLSRVGEALITDQSDALEFMQIPGLYTLNTQEIKPVLENPMAAELRRPV